MRVLEKTYNYKMATGKNTVEVKHVERPDLAKHDSKVLDLAFAMDCTGSMGSYIKSATDNIRIIVEKIVASEKSDVRLALVEYRDHPPQDSTFVTRVHDFTASPGIMKGWLSNCQAAGGGDGPEAVADALHDVMKLSWREEATKICVCISDAPPHGIGGSGDGFPNGCPAGIDPMDVTNRLAEKGITIYMVGCEPSINPYKEFFMAMAFITGGQYVPLTKANLLTQVIIGGAREEMSMEQFMAEVDVEVQNEIAAGRDIDEDLFSKQMHEKLKSKGVRTNQLHRNCEELATADSSPMAKKLTKSKNLKEVRENYAPTSGASYSMASDASVESGGFFGRIGSALGFGGGAPPSRGRAMMSAVPPPPSRRSAPGMMDAAPPAPADDIYECVEDEISYAQSSRMVQKSMARNFAKKK